MRTVLLAVVVAIVATQTVAMAHEITVQGTVAAIEAKRIQIKTGKEKAGASPEWYLIDARTKIRRGTKALTLSEAKIAVNERVVAIIDHPAKGPMVTMEIRLAAR
jgi:hypothetical protein